MPQADAQTNTEQQEYRLSIPHHAICQNPELQPGSRVEQDHIDVWMNQTEFTKLMGPQANIIDFMQLSTEDSQGFGIRVQFVDVDAQESPRNWQTRVIQACRQAQGQPAAAYGEIMKMARTRENLEPRAAWFLICLFRETLHPSEMPDARILELMAEADITPDQVLQGKAQAPETGRHPAQRAGRPTNLGGRQHHQPPGGLVRRRYDPMDRQRKGGELGRNGLRTGPDRAGPDDPGEHTR